MQPPLRGNEAITPPQHYAAWCPCLPPEGKQRMLTPPGTVRGGRDGQKTMVWHRHHKACEASLTSLVIVHQGFGVDLHEHLDFFTNKFSRVGTFYFQLPTKVKFSHLGQGWRYCFAKVSVSAATSVFFFRKRQTPWEVHHKPSRLHQTNDLIKTKNIHESIHHPHLHW